MECDISFIGLGQMGYGMASNIRKKLSKNSTMFINDVNSEACERFANEHESYGPIEVVSTAKEAASRAPVLVSIVPAADHVRQVYLDKENGVIAAPPDKDRLILESSTIDVDSQREVGSAIRDAGVGSYYDAPVSGGQWGAAAGTLAFMIGCAEDDPKASQIRQVVSMMSHPDKIFLCGPLGNGAAAKISNNYLSGPFLLAIAESFAIGIKNGLDKDVLANVIRNSSGMSWMGEHMHPVPGVVAGAPSSNGYKVGFRHELMVKDTTLGIEAAEKNGVEPSMARTAVEMYRRAAGDTRTEGLDASSVYKLVFGEE
ncbi:hypothetical protein LTR09_002554 [Extremus antarcticus]|uniref:3-hydroxyisobutyrate dehydrogenase n=1 Tax=Extremus antarcticus TaxID=702011 RepID=A0AAJ0GFX4_9PEZI|nr:hypothetical protein LTR09_002554 [Extremus antarcticus]